MSFYSFSISKYHLYNVNTNSRLVNLYFSVLRKSIEVENQNHWQMLMSIFMLCLFLIWWVIAPYKVSVTKVKLQSKIILTIIIMGYTYMECSYTQGIYISYYIFQKSGGYQNCQIINMLSITLFKCVYWKIRYISYFSLVFNFGILFLLWYFV